MNYHYLDSANQPAGPASMDEIRALAAAGKIAADPLVAPEGGQEWKLLSAFAEAKPPAARTLPFASTLLGDFVAVVVKHVAGWLNPKLIGVSLRWARDIGHYAVLVGGALALVFALITAIRMNSFTVFLLGLGFVVALAVAQFAAQRFLASADALIANTPSRLSSFAFLECTGLLAVLAAVALLVAGVVTSIQLGSAAPLIPAVLGAAFWGYIGAIALHPELASMEAGKGSAAEEAIGILAFFCKAALKIVPLFFGILAVVGAIVVLVSIFAPNSSLAYALSSAVAFVPLPGMQGPGFLGAGAVLLASLLPMAAYFLFLLACLPLEIWRAILSLPGKLDALKR
jgi:hypothetical protein